MCPYAFIAENYQLSGGSIVWDLHFRQNSQDKEVAELSNMLTLLQMNYLSFDRMDKRVRKPDSTGNFSVKWEGGRGAQFLEFPCFF